ncbi:hypothetical protein J2853_009568 [Streptosporangium lutulentum]|uniref:Uncharacterized protein n=2 Tax=Streptosporangium lutulentum TaxID=1461250 RepID=A0ABT9QU26_9ACTN|nr:hypothetical protein [Streptosporangium lutulentum]
MITITVRGGKRLRVWAIGVVATTVAYYAIMMPFYVWSVGGLEYYAAAVGPSIALGLATTSIGVLTVIRLRGPRRDTS